ncbi:hypothetical protein [Vibrio brasiliensis]|uniref:hypothetical protein n=1 Tax=Vibrio brasiliensis TaxID=170652 RepID=UPI001EFE3212|nr:hypothetical protein [Vibrio brasiliensis]MCG9727878.1 hypothetical protein [Vibrio brasiliensis]
MTKKVKKELSPNHNGPKGRKDTLKQIKLRVALLNDFIENGVPEGFTAHTNLKELLAYSDGNEIQSRSYPAIHAKRNIPILEIDPSFSGDVSKTTHCKDYLILKINELKSKQKGTSTTLDSSLHITTEDKNQPQKAKVKTKEDLRNTIQEQAILIDSLVRELLQQRNANNTLISLIRERDKYASRTLNTYFKEYQEDICKVREIIKPSLKEVIANLNELSSELETDLPESEENVVSIYSK